MANPIDSDTNGEWFEVYNTTSKHVVLDRMVIRQLRLDDQGGAVIHSEHNIRLAGELPARSYFVLGDGAQPYVDYAYDDDDNPLGIGESFGALAATVAAGISLGCRGTTIDTFWYGTDTFPRSPEAGRSMSFDGGVAPDELLNDDAQWWCSGGRAYDDVGNLGSPGSANVSCGLAVCVDGGVERDVVAPRPGDLVLTEVFADPDGADANREWIELYTATDLSVDFNGLRFVETNATGGQREWTLSSQDCLPAGSRQYHVLGVVEDGAAADPRLGAAYVLQGDALYNAATTFEIWRGQVLIDAAEFPAPKRGVSAGLDSGLLMSSSNDSSDSFCAATSEGSFGEVGELGTPGVANDICGVTCLAADGTRRRVGPVSSGDLVLTEVYADPTGSDAGRDWAEFYVTSNDPIDLNGVTVESSNATPTTRSWEIDADECLTLNPQSYYVIGGPNAETDGVAPIATFGSATSTLLFRSPGPVQLSLHTDDGAVVIDSMSYPGATSGVSYALTSSVLDVADNDIESNWCLATSTVPPFTDGMASPGVGNEICP